MTRNSITTSLAMLLLATMVVSSMASRDWKFGFNYTDWRMKHRGWTWWSNRQHLNITTQTPQNLNKIIVGDSEHWRFNFNYANWTCNHGPFYLSDVLVFKYDPPVGKDSHPHSVYQLPDYKSFVNCDLKKAVRLANATQGVGEGFEVVLNKLQPYYFACGESNGYHCKVGLMKFSVMPLIRSWRTHN